MDIQKIKKEIKNKSANDILYYLEKNQLTHEFWFQGNEKNETLFFNLFFKDVDLGSKILNAFYENKALNYSSVMHNEALPCYFDNYFKSITGETRLVDYLSHLINPQHIYDEKTLTVLGLFTKGFRCSMDYDVEVARGSLTFYSTFLKNFSQNPKDF